MLTNESKHLLPFGCFCILYLIALQLDIVNLLSFWEGNYIYFEMIRASPSVFETRIQLGSNLAGTYDPQGYYPTVVLFRQFMETFDLAYTISNIRIVSALFSTAAFYFLSKLMVRVCGFKVALILVPIMAFNPLVLAFSNQLLPLAPTFLGCALLIERIQYLMSTRAAGGRLSLVEHVTVGSGVMVGVMILLSHYGIARFFVPALLGWVLLESMILFFSSRKSLGLITGLHAMTLIFAGCGLLLALYPPNLDIMNSKLFYVPASEIAEEGNRFAYFWSNIFHFFETFYIGYQSNSSIPLLTGSQRYPLTSIPMAFLYTCGAVYVLARARKDQTSRLLMVCFGMLLLAPMFSHIGHYDQIDKRLYTLSPYRLYFSLIPIYLAAGMLLKYLWGRNFLPTKNWAYALVAVVLFVPDIADSLLERAKFRKVVSDMVFDLNSPNGSHPTQAETGPDFVHQTYFSKLATHLNNTYRDLASDSDERLIFYIPDSKRRQFRWHNLARANQLQIFLPLYMTTLGIKTNGIRDCKTFPHPDGYKVVVATTEAELECARTQYQVRVVDLSEDIYKAKSLDVADSSLL